jgi:Zn-finger nucleic acid-binding protein/Zn-dependent protease with chaperone function
MGMSEGTIDMIFWGLVGGCLLLTWVWKRWLNGLNGDQRLEFLKWVFLLSPVWMGFGVVVLVLRVPTVISGIIGFVDILTLISIWMVSATYMIVAGNPDELAFVISSSLRGVLGSKDPNYGNFWTFLDQLKTTRRLIASVFFIISIGILFVDLLLVDLLVTSFSTGNHFVVFSFAAMILIGVLLVWFENKNRYRNLDLTETEHGKKPDFVEAVQNMAIACGVQMPEVKVLANGFPTVFTINQGRGDVIWITSGMLNMANSKNQLEALAGHEMAHIFSHRNQSHALIEVGASLVKVQGYMFLLLVMACINPLLFLGWLGIVLRVELGTKNDETTEPWILLNPSYVLFRFLSKLTYYSLAFSEDYYADMKTVQLTREVKSLYEVLSKIDSFKGFCENLPVELAEVYFSGEEFVFRQCPPPQPSIADRQALLERIDATLGKIEMNKQNASLVCPACDNQMQEITTQSHYGQPVTVDRCPVCASVWFDEMELYYIAYLTMVVGQARPEGNLAQKDSYSCPRCKIVMRRVTDVMIANDINVYSCQSCQGRWMKQVDLQKFIQFREAKQKVIRAEDN